MSRIVESLYRTQLNEMALDEMSVQNPARLVKKQISYHNKYSQNDVQKLCNLAFNRVFEEGYSSQKYTRTIEGISNILLSDFEEDFEEFTENIFINLDDEVDEEKVIQTLIKHYLSYANIFNTLYNKCKEDIKIDPDDKDCKALMNSAKRAEKKLIDGVKNFIKIEYPNLVWSYNLVK